MQENTNPLTLVDGSLLEFLEETIRAVVMVSHDPEALRLIYDKFKQMIITSTLDEHTGNLKVYVDLTTNNLSPKSIIIPS